MRQVVTRADAYGPSAGVSVTAPNMPQSNVSSQTAPIPVMTLFGNLQSSVFAQPILWLGGLVLFLIAWGILDHKKGHEVHHVQIGIRNWFVIGLMVLLFFAFVKFLTTKYDIPGFSKLVVYATS